MSNARLATLTLRLDAAANLALAALSAVAAQPLADAARLEAAWPFSVVAALLVGNGLLCWQAARDGHPQPGALRVLAVLDGLFVAAVVGLALADPTAAVAWFRWLLVGLGMVVGVVAAVKLTIAGREARHALAAG